MRKSLVVLLVLALVALFAVYFFIIRKADMGLPDFSFPADQVSQIFIVDKEGNSIQLNKNEKNVWIVNQRYEANDNLMERILFDIQNQKAIGKVAKSKRKLIKENMEAGYKKVKIYDSEKVVREYYIGPADDANRGNYMTMPPLQDIFDVQLIDQYRSMLYDFSTNLNDWRSIWLIDFAADDIKEVKLDYMDSSQNSFLLTNNAPQYEVTGNQPNTGELNTKRVSEYLNFFTDVSFVLIAQENTDRATILAPEHKYASLQITLRNGRFKRYEIYFHPHTESSKNPAPATGYAYDADLLYVLTPGDDELYVVTWPVFGRLLRTYSDFYQN